MKSFLVNIDFEDQLSEQKFRPPHWHKINKELEYLFFWQGLENASLWTPIEYDLDYLNYVENLVGTKPKTKTEGLYDELWWGQLRDQSEFSRQQKANSKAFCAQARKDLGLENFSSFICHSLGDVSDSLAKIDGPFVIKDDICFSGRGFSFKKLEGDQFPKIVEPWVRRVRDFSIFRYGDNEEICCLQTHVNSEGTYKGSLFKETMSEAPSLCKNFEKIEEYYRKELSCTEVQVDAYQYLEGSELNFQFLGEVNHRKTLGKVFWDLHKRFGNRSSFLGIIPSFQLRKKSFKESIDNLGKFHFNPVTKSGVIHLSPREARFSLFFFTEESERALQFLIRDFWKREVKEGLKLPPEFIVYL